MIDAGFRVERPQNIKTSKHVIIFVRWHFKIVCIVSTFRERLVCILKHEVCCIGFFVKYFNRVLLFNKKRLLWFNDLWLD